jgi:lipoprotein-releasing system ATP-binding protein
MMPAMIAGKSHGESVEIAMRELKAVGLEARTRHRPSELSGGEQQRVAIARALALRPRLLLADEPTGNLDSRTALAVMDLIEEMHARERLTTVLVTHNEVLARRCSRILRLQDGALSAAIG